VTLAGFLLRLLFLDRRQLWTDELMQALVVRAGTPMEILAALRTGMWLPAPLDYFVQKVILVGLGESAWTLRFHAVIFGSASIWIFYRIARLLSGDRPALYATILFAANPLEYHYSQEGRPFAAFLFLALLSYLLLIRHMAEKSGGWKGWLQLGVVQTAMLYTSHLGFLVLASQGGALLVSCFWDPMSRMLRKPDPSESGIAPDLPRVRLAQVFAFVVTAAVAASLLAPWANLAWHRPHIAPASEIIHPRLILRLFKELGDNSYLGSALLLLGVITGLRALVRQARIQKLVWLVTWSTLSLPILIAFNLWAGYPVAIGQFLHVVPALVLVAGYGLSYVGEQMTLLDHLPYRISAPAIVYALVLAMISGWVTRSHWQAEPVDWRGTASFLQGSLTPADVLEMPRVHPLLEYYAPRLDSFRRGDMDPGPGVLTEDGVQRRQILCYNLMTPDPCGGFRDPAAKDPAWRKEELQGFTLFIRQKQ